MTPVVWAPQAIHDVEAIRAHVARDSARYADLVVDRLVAAVERLQDHPRSGRVVPELGNESIREVVHGNYRIVYRLRNDVVEIATVFHGARLFRLEGESWHPSVELPDEPAGGFAVLSRRWLSRTFAALRSDPEDGGFSPVGVAIKGRTRLRAGQWASTRFLRVYVRERQAISLRDALAKTSLIPARILEGSVPQMRRKGRIAPDMDADLVVFDLATIADRATYEKPAQTSTGIRHVIVAGVPVIENGTLDPNSRPGRPVRRTPAPWNTMTKLDHPGLAAAPRTSVSYTKSS